ncbi:hypothetical protein GCM10027569_48870 [Flindersiella endophytica]
MELLLVLAWVRLVARLAALGPDRLARLLVGLLAWLARLTGLTWLGAGTAVLLTAAGRLLLRLPVLLARLTGLARLATVWRLLAR